MSQGPVTYVTIDPREQVQWPAILLAIVGGLGVLLQLASILMQLVGAGFGVGQMRDAPEAVRVLMSGAVGIVFAVIGLLVSAFIIYGALQMKQLRAYGLSIATAIVAMLPCLSPCCCVGLPVGIWALVVLFKPGVKEAFR